MTDLVTFMNARLDEEEAAARALMKPYAWGYSVFYEASPAELAHIERYRPARVLADVTAKRAILAAYVDAVLWHQAKHPADPDDIAKLREEVAALRLAVEALTNAYADHADFDQAWKLHNV